MKLIKILLLICIVMILTACGGGGSSSSSETGSIDEPNPSVELYQGIFVDTIVEGLKYATNSQSGYTDAEGKFNYKNDENITFWIGDIKLGTIPVQPTITPLDLLVYGQDQNSSTFINMIRLIQTLDDDRDPGNGIQINEHVHAIATGLTNLELNASVYEFENNDDLLFLIQTAVGKDALISSSEALSHWENTYKNSLFFHAETGIPEYPVIFLAYDESRITPTYDENGTHTGAYIDSGDGDAIYVGVNKDATPNMIIVDNTTFVFLNYTEDTVDIGIIDEDGEVDVLTDMMNLYTNIYRIGENNLQSSTLNTKLVTAPSLSINSDNVAGAAASAATAAVVIKLAAEQLAAVTTLKTNVKFTPDLTLKLTKAKNSAMVKQVLFAYLKDKGYNTVNIGDFVIDAETADTIWSIAKGAGKCAVNSVANAADCYEVIITSVLTTAKAVEVLKAIVDDKKIRDKIAQKLYEKGLVKKPLIVVKPLITAYKTSWIGDKALYRFDIKTSGSISSVDESEPVTNFTYKINGKEVIRPWQRIPLFDFFTKIINEDWFGAGTHTIEVTGTDNYGLSDTVKTTLYLPEAPVVEDKTIAVSEDNPIAKVLLSAKPAGDYDFKITDPIYGVVSPIDNVGNFKYTLTNPDAESDSFEYYVKMKLNKNCMESGDFDCTVDSNRGKININIESNCSEGYKDLNGRCVPMTFTEDNYSPYESGDACPVDYPSDLPVLSYNDSYSIKIYISDKDQDGYAEDYLKCKYYRDVYGFRVFKTILYKQTPYIDDKINGIEYTYGLWDDGTTFLKRKAQYVNGTLNGVLTDYFPDGSIEQVGQTLNGYYHGEVKSFVHPIYTIFESYFMNWYRIFDEGVLLLDLFYTADGIGYSCDDSPGVYDCSDYMLRSD